MAELLRMYNMITYIKGRGPLQYTANRRLPNVKYPIIMEILYIFGMMNGHDNKSPGPGV